MRRLEHVPYPHRFRTWDDAMKFQITHDPSLCVPSFIDVDGKLNPNPEYDTASYEQRIVKLSE